MKDINLWRTIKKPIGYRFYSMLVGVSLFSSVSAAVDKPLETISLSDAVVMTLEHHPDLKALVSQERVLQGRIQQAGIGERPQIGFMIEDAAGTGAVSGFKSMEATLTYSWVLQGEQVSSRVDAVKSETATLEIKKQIKALDVSAMAAQRYIDVLVKQERLKLNKVAVAQAREVVNAIAKRVDAGKSSNVEVQLAKAELIRRELAVEDIEHEFKASLYQLTSLWGKPENFYHLSGSLLSSPNVPSVESQMATLKQNPRLQQYVTEQRIAQSKIELARIEAKPLWQFSAGVRRYEATDDFGLVAGFSLPWGDTNRNAGAIAALQAQQEVLASEQRGLLQSLDTQLYVLLQEMNHSQHVIQTVQKDIIPTLEQALSDAVDAFERGQLSYTQYSGVRRELLSAQIQLLDAFESLHLQHIEIQRLTGTSLPQRDKL